MSQKRVLICMPVLLKGGGTEIQVLTLCTVLITEGYRVTVCCYYEFDQSIVELFQQTGAETVLLGLNRSNGRFGPSKIYELFRKLSQTFQKYHPDVVHVQYLAPGLIPIIAARLAGVPTVFATVHIAGSIAYGLKEKFLLRLASRFCTAFFCISRGVEDFWFGNNEVFDPKNPNRKRKHFTIYNSIDSDNIERIVDSVDCETLKRSVEIRDKKVVGIVGRLAPQKGHVILLDAMAEIIRENPNVMLVAIGDGPDRGKLEDRAMELGITGHIQWMGAMKPEDLYQLYGIMDVFVMPSLYEGFGLAAAEAMAAGLPVVGTKVDGLSEIIEDGVTGYLLPAGDSHQLARALIRSLSNAEKRKTMGQRGKDRVRKLFSVQRFSNSIIAAYHELSKN